MDAPGSLNPGKICLFAVRSSAFGAEMRIYSKYKEAPIDRVRIGNNRSGAFLNKVALGLNNYTDV
jgi:hypothetical protein